MNLWNYGQQYSANVYAEKNAKVIRQKIVSRQVLFLFFTLDETFDEQFESSGCLQPAKRQRQLQKMAGSDEI